MEKRGKRYIEKEAKKRRERRRERDLEILTHQYR